MTKRAATYRHVSRLVGAVCVLAVLGVVAWGGYQWQAHLKVERVEITGAHHADRAELLKLVGVDTTMRLFGLDPALLADRLRRHPWVESAEVTRLPTGTLSIHVTERIPVVLVLDEEGTPSHYLDAYGFQMPIDSAAVYNVPLLRGQEQPYHPVRRIESASTRALLAVLAARGDAFVSAVEQNASGAWRLYTRPTRTHNSIPVRLGRPPFEQKFRRLKAFWQQAVRTQPHTTFELIDVRFDGQIVSRQHFVRAQKHTGVARRKRHVPTTNN